ncbi:MAG TPA: TetR/AcrR family transcriptional regulator [Pseudonocardiaceae bacterium]|jgi:AcrR family transcriptional regulator|nr:TetR/AcrR family transcriptional regulator [Pseudonocardiaceae bacterium]
MPSVTRKTQASRQERRTEIERQLLDATERLMGEGLAFTELSVDRLATEAGISRATFYVYFEDKGQLLRTMAARVFGELADGARTWWDVVERHDPEDVRKSMATIIDIYRRHQALLTAVIEMAAYDPEVGEFYQQLLDGIAGGTRDVIERGKANGSIRAALPTREIASGLTWVVERTVHQTVRFTTPEQDGALARALAEIIWSTLYLEPAG